MRVKVDNVLRQICINQYLYLERDTKTPVWGQSCTESVKVWKSWSELAHTVEVVYILLPYFQLGRGAKYKC